MTDRIEGLLREFAPQALGALARRFGHFADAEDAVQEALLEAGTAWARDGVPDNPRGWLITVGSRRLIDAWRSAEARHRREETAAALELVEAPHAGDFDDSLTLLLLCCHPALTPSSQVALTLRAVGGLTTAEIARAYLVPEATIAQRISRAKKKVADAGARFELPPASELPARIQAVEQVLYLIFTEGHTATSGEQLARVDLSAEAIRLTRQLTRLIAASGPELAPGADLAPLAGEADGLLALLLLTDARRPARTASDGSLVPLTEQDRSLWDREQIAEGVGLVTQALMTSGLGPFQLQAAIAAVHAESPSAEQTDWPQILGLYDILRSIAPGPMVTLGRIVAAAMVDGPLPALLELEVADADPALAGNHRIPAVRAHLLELAGEPEAAREQYRLAATLTLSLPEQRYLLGKAAGLG